MSNKYLKDFEKIKYSPCNYGGSISHINSKYPFEIKNIEKVLKAFEIIKTKKVDVWALSVFKSLKSYNKFCGSIYKENALTLEEYNFLKKVLF